MGEAPKDALDDIAAELLALPPDEFTAARNAKAKELDDPQLVKDVKGLRKPVLAAWAVNLFARERAAQLQEVLDLAEALREAQDDLDAAALTALTRQRRALVRGLTAQAADLAKARGQTLTPAVTEAVEQTLNAAMFDVRAAAAVASGRLLRPLDPADDLAAVLPEAVAGSLPSAPERREVPEDEVGARRARKEAERRLHQAETDAARTEREHGRIAAELRAATARVDELAEQERRLEAELTRVREARDEARTGLGELEERLAAAARAHEDARHELEQARAQLQE
ncbi:MULTISPECIES: transposase [Microbacterium]|uniref:transposase n=1 Tax=Microbacterium TaxID=33882 RepID=UPI00217F1EE5|nr:MULTISPECIES: transposase [Microbacterium]UWF76685.1 transposase [Microbacterium neungamense]WCM54835.1 transposase [Microbacterium sp. EF45047]